MNNNSISIDKEEIAKIGLKYQVLTEYTSLFGSTLVS